MIDLDEKLIKSSHLQAIRDGESVVIWHSLFGYPQIISAETLEYINLYSSPSTIREQSGDSITGAEMDVVERLIRYHFLVPEGFDERDLLSRKMAERESDIINGSMVDNLSLIMSEECNFRCDYCIHFKNLETSSRADSQVKFMRFEIAKEAVDSFLKTLRDNGKHFAEINFGGGEPLLAWPIIKKVLEYCDTTYKSEFDFKFSINTNASLITHAIAEMFKKYQLEISSSLDGLQEGNDKVRIFKAGDGAFYAIVSGFDQLRRAEYPLTGFSITITAKNFHDIDESIIDWAAGYGIHEVRIDIDVIDAVDIPIEAIVAKLMRLRRYAQSKSIDVPGFWSRPAENMNESALDSYVSFCGAARGNSVCISPSGDIYGCGYSTTKLGVVRDIATLYGRSGGYHSFVSNRLTGRLEMCRGCMIEGQCAGGCSVTREFASATGIDKLKPMCDLYRRMTEEILLEQLRSAEMS